MTEPLVAALAAGDDGRFVTLARADLGNETLAHQAARLAFEGIVTAADAMRIGVRTLDG